MANHKLDNIIVSGQWEIEPFAGLQYLAQYMHDLEYIESGGVFADLRYSERRAELAPRLANMQAVSDGRFSLSSNQIPAGSIVHLFLTGAMRLEDGFSSVGVRQLIRDIQAADANPNIAGILLEVNSGGGEASAGTELQNALADVRRNGQTRVGVYAQLAASAALRGTLPVDFVMGAGRSAQFGSVGTYASVNNQVLKYIRDNYADYYAAQSTQKNLEWRQLQVGNPGPLLEMLTKSAQEFIDEVLEGRTITGTPEQRERLTSGAMFGAVEAMEIGLIDFVGTFGQAVEKLQGLIETGNTTPTNGGRGFMNDNNFDMEFKNFLPSLNRIFGWSLKEDATPEQVTEALEAQSPVAEMVENAKKEMRDELSQAGEASDKKMAEILASLTARLDAVDKQNKELQETVVGMKATHQKGDQGASGARVPDASQFNTTQQVFGSRVVE